MENSVVVYGQEIECTVLGPGENLPAEVTVVEAEPETVNLVMSPKLESQYRKWKDMGKRNLEALICRKCHSANVCIKEVYYNREYRLAVEAEVW